jgi:KDO2-lipid IV(A) lauroyltransferase
MSNAAERSILARGRHALELGALRALSVVLHAAPRSVALALGGWIGRAAWALRVRRRRVMDNLAIAFPESDENERKRIGQASARNFGRTVAEFLRFPGGDRAAVGEFVEIRGLEALLRLEDEGKSAALVTAHLGAWALYVAALASAGVRPALLVGKQTNPGVDQLILELPGNAVTFISKGRSAPRHMLEAIRSGRLMVMVADHYSSDQKVRVDFMGKPAYTLPLPGALVEKHGLALFRMTGRRIDGGLHVVDITPIPLEEIHDREEMRVHVAQRMNRALGEAIRDCPEQYFWYHNRWKHRGR